MYQKLFIINMSLMSIHLSIESYMNRQRHIAIMNKLNEKR